jgi:hypothetical protein
MFRFQIVGRFKREVPTENPTAPTFLRLPPRKSLVSHLYIMFFGVTVLLSRPNFVLVYTFGEYTFEGMTVIDIMFLDVYGKKFLHLLHPKHFPVTPKKDGKNGI